MSDSLQPQELYSPWNSPGQNTGVGSLSLLQGIFPTQGLNGGLPHCRQILHQQSHQGKPRILEWVACSFSSRCCRPRNLTRVSCIVGGFFINQALREDLKKLHGSLICHVCKPLLDTSGMIPRVEKERISAHDLSGHVSKNR